MKKSIVLLFSLFIVMISIVGILVTIIRACSRPRRRYSNRLGDIMHSSEMRIKELEEKLSDVNERVEKLERDKIDKWA